MNHPSFLQPEHQHRRACHAAATPAVRTGNRIESKSAPPGVSSSQPASVATIKKIDTRAQHR
jgi:hypothetical protein